MAQRTRTLEADSAGIDSTGRSLLFVIIGAKSVAASLHQRSFADYGLSFKDAEGHL